MRRRVAVSLVGGRTLDGEVFLQPNARYRSGPQDPGELFNERDAFVPLSIGAETHVLLAKDHVTRVQFEADSTDVQTGNADVAVEVVFADGTRVSGQLRLERTDRSRLLDFLNVDHQRFLTLRSASTVYLINRAQVAQVLHRSPGGSL
ncbi:MAG TPA: hypothetical protein VIP11_17300 [Gemmatimonadaceae bacterium]